MNRKDFVQAGCCALAALASTGMAPALPAPRRTADTDAELKFVRGWVTDLMNTLDGQFDEASKIRLMSGCGRGCYDRHSFKQDISKAGSGSVEKLIEALKKNFEVWREDDTVHIRYGAVSQGCYCPAAWGRDSKPDDIHCYCTRATHQAIWEEALGVKPDIDILETVRRGNQTCHFLVHIPENVG